MLLHFGAIADATSLPVVVYNIPARTCANMLPATLLDDLDGRFEHVALSAHQNRSEAARAY